MNPPTVSVLTAVHNAERYIRTTVESILNQTFTDFEYLLINDHSTDNSPAILQEYATQDPRVRVLHTPEHAGPSGTLNFGLQQARGRYFANLDHDDIAMPTRLEQQVAYLAQHPTIGAVGGLLLVIDQAGNPHPVSGKKNAAKLFPVTPATSRWAVNFLPPLPHCTLTVRREAMERVGGYSLRYQYICDYDIEVRLAEHVDMANVPEILAAYRKYPEQTSEKYRTEQNGMYFLRIAAAMRRCLGVAVPLNVVATFYHATGGIPTNDRTLIPRIAALFEQLYQHFLATEQFTPTELAWVRNNYAAHLSTVASANQSIAPEECTQLFDRAKELHELAKCAT